MQKVGPAARDELGPNVDAHHSIAGVLMMLHDVPFRTSASVCRIARSRALLF
jgi:hypothetical protein